MNQQKQNHFKLFGRSFFATAVLSVLISFGFATVPTSQASASSECSDVYTPLSSSVVSGVAANKSFYVQAMNETGVPWEMLAAIHYRETNFGRNNPSNGQGIFQFVNGDGGPYPTGPVSDANFYQQLKFMATKLQSDYVWRGSVPRERRQLVPDEQNMTLIKDTLFSYNGRAQAYSNQAASYGYNSSTQPYEGSPYVMNRFDCARARMGIITRDYGTGIDSTDTRYGAFTIFARLRGDNFWLLLTRAYSWQLVSQEHYLDPQRTKPADMSLLSKDQKVYLRIKAKNLGSSSWTRDGSNPTLLATTNPSNRNSAFCDESWLNCSRPARLLESSVAPGGVGTWEFSAAAPSIGNFNEYFNLVAEGKDWFNDIGAHWRISVAPPTPRWQIDSQTIYSDSQRTKPVSPASLSPSTTYYLAVTARNTGNTVWSNSGANPVKLGTNSPQDRASSFSNNTWGSANRAATLTESQVKPGDIGSFTYSITTPSSYGTYNESFRPVVEGSAWMNDIGMYWPFTVEKPTARWQVQSQQVYTDSSKSQPISGTVSNGARLYMVITARNTGNSVWSNSGANPVKLGTNSPQDRASEFYDSSWLGTNRATRLKESSVAPGETGTFEFWLQSPHKPNDTIIYESFRPVVEGSAWMNDIGMYWPFTFKSADTNWEYVSQSAFLDSSRTQYANLGQASTNTNYYLSLRVKNTSGLTWNQSSLLLGTNSPQDRSSSFFSTSWIGPNRASRLKEMSVSPGQYGTFEFTVRTPSSPAQSNEHFRPVIEGKTWLTDIGLFWAFDVK